MATDEASTAASGRPLGAISTLVSLFLLLLVFFIVLVSISRVHQQRLDAVLISIDDAFGGMPSGLGLLPPPRREAVDASPEAFARAVSTLVTGFSMLAESGHAAPAGTLVEIDLAPVQVFQADSTRLQPEVAASLDRLAVLLQRRPPGQHYRLTLRAVLPEGARNAGFAIDRIAGFAAALFARGCPADALAIGLQHGPTPALRFDFAIVGTPEEAD